MPGQPNILAGEGRVGRKLGERGGRGRDLGELLGEGGVDAAVHHGVVIVERAVQQVVQAEGDERALQEGEDPHTGQADRCHEALEGADAVLHVRPHQAGDERGGKHHEERDHVDERGAGEHAEPLGKLGLEELVVQRDDDAGDGEGADHAHVERLDARDHGETRRAAGLSGEIDTEGRAPLGQHRGHEIVEGEVGDEHFHAAARVLLVGQADGQRDRKQQRQLVEDRPTALQDHVPHAVPQRIGSRQWAEDDLGGEQRAETDHHASERKEKHRREHGTAELLDLLHHGRLPPFLLESSGQAIPGRQFFRITCISPAQKLAGVCYPTCSYKLWPYYAILVRTSLSIPQAARRTVGIHR